LAFCGAISPQHNVRRDNADLIRRLRFERNWLRLSAIGPTAVGRRLRLVRPKADVR